MKKIVLVLALLVFSLGFSQTENSPKQEVVNSLKTAYNNSNHQVLYSLFSKDYKSKKTLKDVTAYFKRYKNALGNITVLNSFKNENGYTKFPVKFNEQQKTLVIKYNANNKIDYLSINK